MESHNYEFLSTELRFLGFGDSLFSDLKEMLETEHPSFELAYCGRFDDELIEATLFFTRPDPQGYFFFSKYEMILGERRHTFYVFQGKGITVKESFNLLSGRAVYKQRIGRNGQKYNEWTELDLGAPDESGYRIIIYPESHGFHLADAVEALQIAGPTVNWDKHMLIRSLQKGNLQPAFIKEADMYRKVGLQADPRNRTVAIHETQSPPPPIKEEAETLEEFGEGLKSRSRAKKLKDVV
jgi:hypothetical protein